MAILWGMEDPKPSKMSQAEIEWWRGQLPPSHYPMVASPNSLEDGHGEAASGVSGITLTPPLSRGFHGPAYLQVTPCRPMQAEEELLPHFFANEEDAEPVAGQVIPPSMEELKLLDFLKMLYAKLEQPTRMRGEFLKKLQEDRGDESFDLDAREQRAGSIDFTHIINVIGVMEMAHSLVMLPPYTPTDFVQKKDDFNQAISALMAIITNDIIPGATFTSLNHYYVRFLSLTSQFITIILRRMGPNAASREAMERFDEVNEMRDFLKSQKSF